MDFQLLCISRDLYVWFLDTVYVLLLCCVCNAFRYSVWRYTPSQSALNHIYFLLLHPSYAGILICLCIDLQHSLRSQEHISANQKIQTTGKRIHEILGSNIESNQQGHHIFVVHSQKEHDCRHNFHWRVSSDYQK